jgi:hypothetical protein
MGKSCPFPGILCASFTKNSFSARMVFYCRCIQSGGVFQEKMLRNNGLFMAVTV